MEQLGVETPTISTFAKMHAEPQCLNDTRRNFFRDVKTGKMGSRLCLCPHHELHLEWLQVWSIQSAIVALMMK